MQQRASAAALAVREKPVGFNGLWGFSGDKRFLIDPTTITAVVDAQKKSRGLDSADKLRKVDERAKKQEQCVVRSPRARSATIQHGRQIVFGCFNNRKNMCRDHVLKGDVHMPVIHRLCVLMNEMVKALSKEVRESCTALYVFAGEDDDDDRCPLVVHELLVLAREKPRMQLFANCTLEEMDLCAYGEGPRSTPGQRCPYEVRVATAVSRLSFTGVASRTSQVVSVSTSDELSVYLARMKRSWRVYPLQYRVVCEGPSLLRMVVDAYDAEFMLPPMQERAARKATFQLPRELEMGTPWRQTGDNLVDAEGELVDDSAPESGDDLGDNEDHDDVVEDRLAVVVEHRGMPVVAFDEEGENSNSSSDADSHSLERLLLEELEPRDDARPADLPREEDAEVPPEPAAASTDEPAGAPSLAACLAATEELHDGYFRCNVGPWQRFARCGRITIWPSTVPYEQRIVAIKCYIHGCSITRRRRWITNEEMLMWLFSGTVRDGAVDGPTARADKDEHTAKAVHMLPSAKQRQRELALRS